MTRKNRLMIGGGIMLAILCIGYGWQQLGARMPQNILIRPIPQPLPLPLPLAPAPTSTRTTFYGKPWTWVETLKSDDTTVKPRADRAFSIIFSQDQTVSIKTDCNSVGGTYTLNGDALAFTAMRSTMMYCEGSQEQAFTQMLSDVERFHFTAMDELVLDLKQDQGSIVLK